MIGCVFCLSRSHPVDTFGLVYRRYDKYPVTERHTLIIPRRHIESWFDATDHEVADLLTTLTHLRAYLMRGDASITGFNVGINDGVSAGQTVMHAHAHLIPRRDGDMADPAGGVRGVIPEMQKYEVTS